MGYPLLPTRGKVVSVVTSMRIGGCGSWLLLLWPAGEELEAARAAKLVSQLTDARPLVALVDRLFDASDTFGCEH